MSITKAKRDRIRNDILSKFNSDPSSLLSTFIDESLKKYLAPGLKSASAKGKGRKMQQWVRDRVKSLLVINGMHHEDHVRSTPMGVSGEDIQLSPAARRSFPFAVECKNSEKIGFWPTVDQAVNNAGPYIPLIVFGKNRTKPWVAFPAEDFFELLENVAFYLYGIQDSHFDLEDLFDAKTFPEKTA